MSKHIRWLVGIIIIGFLLGGCESKTNMTEGFVWMFEKDDPGSIPSGWTIAETNGQGTPATWQIVADGFDGAQAVAITETTNSGQTYNLLIHEQVQAGNLEISVSVKAGTGKEDQGGGPIWRAIDADNYYVARWNPLEDNFRVYFVRDGKRKQIATAEAKLDPEAWHTISIRHQGRQIKADLDGKPLIEVVDETFTEPGKIGLWTKADAATLFDSVILKPLD
ncbi:MAG: hypothetical protein JXA82_03005 [Sedimentisphaerales bacterium]|nr:hypothetical protein [Sedimentisphaerales bacterium]